MTEGRQATKVLSGKNTLGARGPVYGSEHQYLGGGVCVVFRRARLESESAGVRDVVITKHISLLEQN